MHECSGWNATVALLLSLGADPWLLNADQEYPLTIAEKRFSCPISMLLRKVGVYRLSPCSMCCPRVMLAGMPTINASHAFVPLDPYQP